MEIMWICAQQFVPNNRGISYGYRNRCQHGNPGTKSSKVWLPKGSPGWYYGNEEQKSGEKFGILTLDGFIPLHPQQFRLLQSQDVSKGFAFTSFCHMKWPADIIIPMYFHSCVTTWCMRNAHRLGPWVLGPWATWTADLHSEKVIQEWIYQRVN
jgi:hypothetical protein